MFVIYNIIWAIISIPVLLFFLVTNYKNRKSETFFQFKEKLGFWKVPLLDKTRETLWFHCVSLGEIKAAEHLIKDLMQYRVLITTQTLDGYKYAKDNSLSELLYCAPFDYWFALKVIFEKIQPKALILVETEIWPAMIYMAKKNNLKILIINGRLSEKSFVARKLTRFVWKKVLSNIDCICARSNNDANRFEDLGYDIMKLHVTGNLKYDAVEGKCNISRLELHLNENDLVLTGGSTKEGEEDILLNAYLRLKVKYPLLKVIIAPRHISRVKEIENILFAKGVKFKILSNLVDADYDCLLVDSIGVLQKIYSISDLSFVGGSLINKGGQNPIEPASYSIPVIFGPNMQNFSSEADILKRAGGGFEVVGEEELYLKIDKLLADVNYRLISGKNAFISANSQKGALSKTKEILLSHLI